MFGIELSVTSDHLAVLAEYFLLKKLQILLEYYNKITVFILY